MAKKTTKSKKKTSRRSGDRVTLAQVAAESGVAVSTVSHILNGRESCYASQETRDRVAQAARDLGYRPNLAARALRGGSTATLGLVTTALDVEISAMKCMHFEQAARDNGYLAIMSFNPNDAATEDRLIMWLRDRSVDGIAVCPSEFGSHEELRALVAEGFPVMTFDGAGLLDFEIDDVSVDYVYGGQLQAQHLLELGKRKACVLNTSFSCFVVDERKNAFIKTMVDAGCSEPVQVNLERSPDEPSLVMGISCYEPIRDYLDKNRGKFDALVAVGDTFALAAVRAAFSLGIRVPEELAIVGFDGIVSTQNTPIPVTTVQHPVQELGRIGFEILQQRLRGQRKAIRQVKVKPELLVRASTIGQ